jgi:hypothetical protein
MKRVLVTSLLGFAFLLISSVSVRATTIFFDAVPLGGDLWRYDYFLNGGSFDGTREGFRIFFDVGLYTALEDPPPSVPDWDLLIFQPDLVLDSAGKYDALALVDDPAFVGPFSVAFTWLGLLGTEPGSQPFDIYRLDSSGIPVPVETGRTRPLGGAVPEPSAFLLLALGALARQVLRTPGNRFRTFRPARSAPGHSTLTNTHLVV